MKKIILILILILLVLLVGCDRPVEVNNQSVSGDIDEDQIWSGTIRVTGDVEVADGATITILPGTVVLISAGSDDRQRGFKDVSAAEHADPIGSYEYSATHTSINGRLIAKGLPGKKILFTSDAEEKKLADWQHIGLKEGSVVDNVIVEYGGRCGLCVNDEGKEVVISNSVVRHVLWGCLGLGRSSATVVGNEIYDCGHEGIDTQPGGGRPVIRDNLVKSSARGLMLNKGSFPVVENNTLIDNVVGIEIKGEGEVRGNYISSPDGPANDWRYGDFVYKGRKHGLVGDEFFPEERVGIVTAGEAELSDNMIEEVEVEVKVEEG